MKTFHWVVLSVSMIMASAGFNLAHADQYSDTVEIYSKSPAVKSFLDNCYGYAVFPTVGKGGLMYEASVGGQKFSFEPKQ